MKVLLFAAALAAPVSSACGQVALGQTNNFQDGTSQNWVNGGPAIDPQIIPDGGPAGSGDAWMRIQSDGSGSGGKLSIFNNLDWWGDYVGPGITRIEMDLRNLDPQGRTLNIRLGFRASSNQGSPGYCTAAVDVPANGQWVHAVFTLSPQTMTAIGGPQAWATHMANIGELRLFHSSSPSLTGVNITTALGVDNIRALPTPGAAAVLGLGAMVAGRRRRA